MNRNRLPIILLLGLSCLIAGCGKNVHLGGRVTFEDGTPLTFGKVTFATETFQAEGVIQQNGEYRLGSLHEHDGIPPGTYKVFLLGTEDTSGDVGRSRVAQNFCDRQLTPLQFEVSKNGPKTFDFQVSKP